MSNYDEDNPFWQIINNKLPTTKVYEDDNIIAFNDIYPVAPVHILVIPKHKFIDYEDFIKNANNIEEFFKAIPKIAAQAGLKEYRLITNKGSTAGQTIFHFHMHIIGGTPLYGLIGGKPI